MKTIVAILTTTAALAFTAGPSFASAQSHPFKTIASGTATLAVSGGDTVVGTFNGTATSSHLGTGAWDATIDVPISSIAPAADGQYCGPATGSATLTAASGDLLDFDYAGTVCEQGPALFGVPHTFTGTYVITGGTGRFTNATGAGTITAGDDGNGNAYMRDRGTISYQSPRPTVRTYVSSPVRSNRAGDHMPLPVRNVLLATTNS